MPRWGEWGGWRRQARHHAPLCGCHARQGWETRTLQRLSEPHMLCGLRAHMLDIHTSTCVCVYIYTDIYERDYYRYRFTYIINTRNYCRIFKTAESTPDISKWLSLSLPSQLVPLVRLANATCQSPSQGGCWEGAREAEWVLGRQTCPSPTHALCTGPWEGAKLPSRRSSREPRTGCAGT